MLFSLGGGCVFSIEPHPDATPNTHAPGEVDIKANQKFIIPNPDTLPGIVLDETNAILKGKWQYSTHTPPYVGIGYLHDQKSDKGKKSATFIPDLPRSGKYEVRLSHCYNSRRSTVTPVTIVHANGKSIARINQQDVPKHGNSFAPWEPTNLKKEKTVQSSSQTKEQKGTYVIADAVQFLPKHQRK
jgi:hypothetical protein